MREDKLRESGDGFDGTWVAHPDLVPVAAEVFDSVLGARPNQVERRRDDVSVTAEQLLDFEVSGGEITGEGLRQNVEVGTAYLDSWLRGVGAAAINNLMEDVATAEISRAQVWSWVQAGHFTKERVRDELDRSGAHADAREVFEEVALGEEFVDFLTIPAYERLAEPDSG